jgi:hypothetical protein
MEKEVRETILEAMEQGLEAQLRAVRRLRKGEESEPKPRGRKSRSQVDMSHDILTKAAKPLHINDILERIQRDFGVAVDRESLVSSLTKKVARGYRFVRTDKNTFGLKGGKR